MSKDKVAIVTGSTSGIGLSIVKSLAKKGFNVVLNGFGDIKEINKIKEQIQDEYKVKTLYYNANMALPSEIKAMISNVESEFSAIDILVNNAGIQFTSNIEDFPEEKWNDIIAINLSSVFHTIKYCLPIMKKNNFGRIINIASAHGLVGSVKKAAYVAAKHGVLGLTKVVALENANSNITCNSVSPGWVKTPLVEKQIEDRAKLNNVSIIEATESLLSEKQPSKKFVLPDHIGDLVCFLSSDSASSITGTNLSIDGCWTAQ